MELFPDIQAHESKLPRFVVGTPLGKVDSCVTIDEHQLLADNASTTYMLPSGGMAARWALPQCLTEVILCRPALITEYWSQITDCWAFLWRVQAYEQLSRVKFSGRLVPSSQSLVGGADSGQWLDAQTWDDGTVILSLGTAGGDALLEHAKSNEWFPNRYIAQATDAYELPFVDYVPYGLDVTINQVEVGDHLQIHFAVAWAPYDSESIGTWDAVHQDDVHILEGAKGHYVWNPHM